MNITNYTTMKSLKYAEEERRKMELECYGKLVSLRPSIVMKDKKKYNRKRMKRYEDDFRHYFDSSDSSIHC